MAKNTNAARLAIATYAATVRGEETEPIETQLADLMADLLHVATELGMEHDELMDKARMYVDSDLND
jgi:hypothetical protein